MKVKETVKAARQLAEPSEELWGKIKARLEVWKVIEGFEAYEVSNMGRVRRAVDGRGGSKAGNLLHSYPDTNGYLTVKLYRNGKPRNRTVHVLVAKAFIPNPTNLPHVNHMGRKTNNRTTKLEWRSTRGHGIDRARRGQNGKGVSYDKRLKKWRAVYNFTPLKFVHLGDFVTKKEALAVRKAAIDSLPDIP
jgi:hypothetical protein